MEVVADLKEDTVVQFAQKHVKDGSTISSDAYRSYAGLQKRYVLKAKVFDPDRDAEHLKWLHTIISNAKAFIDGTFHGLGQKHMQNYLDEFCYRFNRRHFQDEIFSRILCSCLAAGPITLTELTR